MRNIVDICSCKNGWWRWCNWNVYSGINFYYFKTDKILEFVDICIYIFWNYFVIFNLFIIEDGINI